MNTPEKTREATETTQHQPKARKLYRRPEVVEFGDVRELTRGNNGTKVDTKSTRHK